MRPSPAMAVAALAALAACAHDAPEPPPAASLAYTSWQIVEIDGEATLLTGDLLTDDRYAVDFGPDSIVGYGGCNRFSATYSRSGDRLVLGPISSTRRACPEPFMSLEYRLFRILETPVRMTRPDTRTLILSGDSGTVRLRMTLDADE